MELKKTFVIILSLIGLLFFINLHAGMASEQVKGPAVIEELKGESGSVIESDSLLGDSLLFDVNAVYADMALEQEKGPVITDVTVEEMRGETRIVIAGDSLFDVRTIYTESKTERYKLLMFDHVVGSMNSKSTHKLVVELDNAELGKFTDRVMIHKGVVEEIVPTQINGLARLEITLTAPAEVISTLNGDSLILSVATANDEGGYYGVKRTPVPLRLGHGMTVQKRVVSMKDRKFKNIVRQNVDFSCGAASLATILNYFYGGNYEEKDIVERMLKDGDQEKIMQMGFSLLDLKIYAEKMGFKADGYRVKSEDLHKINVPTIVLLNIRGYNHFVVLKGVQEGIVYIADPAMGNKAMSMEDFAKGWNNLAFVVLGKREKDSPYERFEDPLGVSRTVVWSVSDRLPRNLFMQPFDIDY